MRPAEFFARLKQYGVEVLNPSGYHKRGKGSEVILFKPDRPGSTKGPRYPIKNHPGQDLGIGTMLAALRRFGIEKDQFFAG